MSRPPPLVLHIGALRAFDHSSKTIPPRSTHCAWKSTSTGSSLLMTLSVKSSLSWTLKETARLEVWGREWGRVREGERKETRVVADRREVEKDKDAMVAVDAGWHRISLTDSVQILRTSSLWAIYNRHQIKTEVELVISWSFHSGWGENRTVQCFYCTTQEDTYVRCVYSHSLYNGCVYVSLCDLDLFIWSPNNV